MPTYVYRCSKCGEKFEEFVSTISQGKSSLKCPKCGNDADRIISKTTPIFGEGFNTPSSHNMNGAVKMNKGQKKKEPWF